MESGLILKDDEERRIKEFKSLYYELNAKPDTTTKIYNDKVLVCKDDIERLEDLIREKLAFHVNDGEFGSSTVIVSTSKHKSHSFNDFKLFAAQNWSIAEYINSMTISWDFFVHVDGYSRPQRHKLTVKISCGMKPEEILSLMFSGRIEDIQEIEEQQATIIAQMDFIENRLGQEFINIVGEWVDTLQKSYTEKNHFILFLKRHRKLVAYYFNYVFSILLSFVFILGLNYAIISFNFDTISELNTNHVLFLLNYTAICILVCFFTLNHGENTANKIFRYLNEYGETFVFRITKGDENKYKKIMSEDKKSAIKILKSLIFSLILNIGCGIIATLICNTF